MHKLIILQKLIKKKLLDLEPVQLFQYNSVNISSSAHKPIKAKIKRFEFLCIINCNKFK